MGMRAATYLRVSTVRQAEKDLSIPDQRRSVEEYCRRKGWIVVSEYMEPGASAKDDNRPIFRAMIDDALNPERPFDVIIVHSFSRFFRDEMYQEMYIRKLAENKVQVQSSTEEVGDGLGGEMARRFLGIIAEVDNRQRAARVKQTMRENARQGFWNGGPTPYGYRVATAEMRGQTPKKRLEIKPAEAAIVELIYDLCLNGSGNGPMGIKAIVEHLNAKGLRYRNGRMFRIGEVHRVLTHSTYMGLHYYGRKLGRRGKLNDPSQWTEMQVPAIVEPSRYEAVQQHLRSRRPSITPARLTNGAMLLTQLAKCPHCGGGMSLSTGKGGKYRYYACSATATKGKAGCKGRRIRMDVLDDVVLTALEAKLLAPDRIQALIAGLAKRVIEKQSRGQEREKELNRELRKAEDQIKRMYDALADGMVQDRDSFRAYLSERHQRRDELLRLIGHNRRRRELPSHLLSKRNLAVFTQALRTRLRDPKHGLQKAYVRYLVNSVVVGEREIRISGSKAALLSAAADPEGLDAGKVPSSVQEWRRVQSQANYSLPPNSLLAWENTGNFASKAPFSVVQRHVSD